MALPTTITGISTLVSCVGPFISSGGNVYFFGVDGTTATTLQAFKATDPTSSFASIATQGQGQNIQGIAGYQVSDVIYLAMSMGTGTSDTTINIIYATFNMATDAFVLQENIQTGIDTRTSGGVAAYAVSIVFRASDSQPIVLYNGTRVASMGTSYARIVYARRTGVNTWTTNVAVDAGGAVDFVWPEAVLGSSNRSHFFFYDGALGWTQRHLTSANALGTKSTFTGGAMQGSAALSFNSANIAQIAPSAATANKMRAAYFASADNPTVNIGGDIGSTADTAQSGFGGRLFADLADLYAVYRNTSDSDLYVAKSTDNGATFAAAVSMFVGTIAGVPTNFSVDGDIFTRGSSVVIPYVVNDNGTLKYNEYVVRSIAAAAPVGGWEAQGAAALMLKQSAKAVGGVPQ